MSFLHVFLSWLDLLKAHQSSPLLYPARSLLTLSFPLFANFKLPSILIYRIFSSEARITGVFFFLNFFQYNFYKIKQVNNLNILFTNLKVLAARIIISYRCISDQNSIISQTGKNTTLPLILREEMKK